MAWAEIIAFIMKIIGWIVGKSDEKAKVAKESLEDIVHEMKKKSESVKLHKQSVDQSFQAKLKRQELLKKHGKKDEMKAPKTEAPKDDRPAWYIIAEKEMGVSEHSPGSNKRIEEYHDAVGSKKKDDIPWCASFVGWCLEQAGLPSSESKLARSYLKYGDKLDDPCLGCIVVLKRGNSTWKGHVGFYVTQDDKYIHLLGGNQSDKVCISKYRKSRVLGYRWPSKDA